MKTAEERVASLHERMRARERKQERRKTAVIGSVCACLTVCLLLLIIGGSTAHSSGTSGIYSGSMLLQNAGGYVLVGVISFAVAVVVTVICIRHQRNQKDRSNSNVDVKREENGNEE